MKSVNKIQLKTFDSCFRILQVVKYILLHISGECHLNIFNFTQASELLTKNGIIRRRLARHICCLVTLNK